MIKISQPIKSHWAKEKNLNLNELLSDSEYKEQYRLDMINWSDEMRSVDYGYFCRIACQNGKQYLFSKCYLGIVVTYLDCPQVMWLNVWQVIENVNQVSFDFIKSIKS